MGYYSRLRGELNFDPPLYSSELLKDIEHYCDVEEKTLPVKVMVGGQYVKANVASIIGLNFNNGDDLRADNFENIVRSIVNQISQNSPTKVNGIVEVFGEDSTDIWRLVVRDNTVVSEEAKIIWPDGEEVDSNY